MHTFSEFFRTWPAGLLGANFSQKTTKNRPVFDSLGRFGAKITRMEPLGAFLRAFGERLDVVSGGGSVAAGTGPVGVEVLPAGAVHAFVGVGAEVVALGLNEVGGKARAAVGVVVAKGGGNGG